MKQIRYTPDAADKLREINRSITLRYGSNKAKNIIKSITNAIKGLVENENKGPSVEKMFGVTTDYRYIFISKNYVFYRVESDYIKIVNIYNEKEDFMSALFGIDTTPQETIDYWNE